ncbi:MAG: histidine kinase, partial [Thermoleophilaceae bacterium]|nr:histidine kinase [Thermoleophilaceae bacterium]
MPATIATGLVSSGGVEAFEEAAARAQVGLGGAPADLVLVFAGAPSVEDVDEGVVAVRDRLGAPALVGCGAQGVVAGGRELEQGGVAVWAASLPGARIETFHLEALPAGEGQVAVAGMPDLDASEALILLADPWSFPVEPVLAEMAEERPGLPVIGGLASLGGRGGGVLMHGDG